MAIERLSFPHHLNIQAGIEVHPDNIQTQLERIVRKFGNHAERLREGNYDITPPIWTKHIYQYNLTVLDSGLGVVRLIPRYPDSHSGPLDNNGLVHLRAGGRTIKIPDDQLIFVLLGPNRLNHHICLYELLFYVPDSTQFNYTTLSAN